MSGIRKAFVDLAVSALAPLLRGKGCILGLHRVLQAGRFLPLSALRDLEIGVEGLEALLAGLRSAGCTFCPMDDVLDELGNRASGKLVVVTLDDGYRDNLKAALPLFEKYEVPFTVYVTSGLVDGTVDPWWYSLQEFVMDADRVRIPAWPGQDELDLVLPDFHSKEDAYGLIYGRIRRAGRDGARFRERLWEANRAPAPPTVEGLFLSWDEVRDLAAHPLASIGAHTVTHPRLSWLESDQAREELTAARHRIEAEIGSSVRHVAYPHGGIDDVPGDIAALARGAGYSTGVMTVPRPLRRSDVGRPWTLPRLFVPGGDEGPKVMKRRISGFEAWRDPEIRAMVKRHGQMGSRS